MSGGRSPVTTCKAGKGTIFIGVLRDDNGAPVRNASVKLTGPTPGSMKTDNDGFAEFVNRDPGRYQFSVKAPNDHTELRNYVTDVTVAANGHAVSDVRAFVTGTLKVELVDDLGKPVKHPVALTAGGASSHDARTSSSAHSFGKVPAGQYQVDALAPLEHYENAQASQGNVVVPEGGSVTVRFVLRILNTVTPHIDAPTHEVLYEPLPPPDPTLAVQPPAPPNTEPPLHLRLHYTETRKEKPFTDAGSFSVDRNTIDVFTDKACTQRFALDGNNQTTVSHGRLAAGIDLYLRDRDRAAGPLQATLTLDTPLNPSIRALGPTVRALQIKALNVVQPKIQFEYKTVLLERGLHRHQKDERGQPEAELHRACPTRIELSATQTGGVPAHPYTRGGKVSVSPAHVELFTNIECKPEHRFDAATLITNAQLMGPGPFALFLRGTQAGAITVKLTMEDPKDGLIRVKPPATVAMIVAEVKGVLHQHDVAALEKLQVDPNTEPEADYHTRLKDLVLPDQKPVSDDAKVAGRRWLHVQDGVASFGRAKLLLPRLDAAQWPADTDEYEIVLQHTGANGTVALHGKEAESDPKALPLRLKVRDLKAAEAVLWVEGSAASTALHDSRLSIGLERPDIADQPALLGTHPALTNGDWMRFTVLKIDPAEIKIKYVAEADEFPQWDTAVNAPTNPRRWYVNVNRKGDPEGRRIKVTAKLTQPFKGVPLRFMLVADAGNHQTANWLFDFPNNATKKDGKGVAQPIKWKDILQTLKHKDRKDRKDLMHWVDKTDDTGMAETKLKLSRFGGDKFRLAVYVEQDPHLAKYIHNHADLGVRKPVESALGDIQVWRKVFYQVTRPQNMALPGLGGFDTSQQRVFMEPTQVNVAQMTAGMFTVNAARPDWQFNPGSGSNTPKLCIGTHNVKEAMALFVKATKATTPKFHVLLCEEQYDAEGGRTNTEEFLFVDPSCVDPVLMPGITTGARDVVFTSKRMQAHKVSIFEPPLQGGNLIVKATWKAEAWDGVKGKWVVTGTGKLPAGNITVRNDRPDRKTVRLTPPAGQLADATHLVRVFVKLLAADGRYLGWAPNHSVTSVVVGGRADAAVQNTVAHEMGHLFGQTRHKGKDGLPDHPLYYQQRGGSGTHCSHGATWTASTDPNDPVLTPTKANELDALGNGAGAYFTGDCIMFAQGLDSKVEWCEHCALDLVLSDLSKFDN